MRDSQYFMKEKALERRDIAREMTKARNEGRLREYLWEEYSSWCFVNLMTKPKLREREINDFGAEREREREREQEEINKRAEARRKEKLEEERKRNEYKSPYCIICGDRLILYTNNKKNYCSWCDKELKKKAETNKIKTTILERAEEERRRIRQFERDTTEPNRRRNLLNTEPEQIQQPTRSQAETSQREIPQKKQYFSLFLLAVFLVVIFGLFLYPINKRKRGTKKAN